MKKTTLVARLQGIFLLCALLAVILQVTAVLLAYGDSGHYFQKNNPLPLLAGIFSILGALIGTVSAFLIDEHRLQPSPFPSKRFPGPALFGFLAAILLLYFYSRNHSFTGLGSGAACLLLCGAAYSALINLENMRNKYSVLLALLGFGTIIGCVLLVSYYYFDSSIEMNAPFKSTVQLGLLSVMVYYTAELRYLLGKARPRLLLILASWVISFGALSAVSIPAAFLADKLDRLDYLAGALPVLCVMLVALNRTRRLLQEPAPEQPAETAGNGNEETTATAPQATNEEEVQ